MKEQTQGGNTDKSRLPKIIRRRLNLEDDDWSIIEKKPKFQKLLQNAKENVSDFGNTFLHWFWPNAGADPEMTNTFFWDSILSEIQIILGETSFGRAAKDSG